MRNLQRVKELTEEYLSGTPGLELEMNQGPRAKPRASTLVSCARNQYYYMGDVQHSNPSNPSQRVTQEQGRLAEDLTVAILEHIGFDVVGRQDEFSEDWYVSGHPDGSILLDINDDSTTLGFEHKVYSSYKYLKVLQHGVERGAPEVLAQAMLYADYYQWTNCRFYILSQAEADVRRGIRDRVKWADSKKPETRARWAIFKEFEFNPKVYVEEVDLTPYWPLLKNLQQRAEDLTRLRAGGILPVREADPDKDNFPCIDWCNWHKKCLSDGAAGAAVTPVPNVFKE